MSDSARMIENSQMLVHSELPKRTAIFGTLLGKMHCVFFPNKKQSQDAKAVPARK